MAAPEEAIREVIEPAIERAGMVLEEVTVRGTKTALVRVVIDLTDDVTAGVGLEQLEDVTAIVSQELDAHPQTTAQFQHYTLEVTSPGAERKLTEPRHWRRSLGRLVAIVTVEGENLQARVLSADSEGARVEYHGGKKNGEERVINYDCVQYAKVKLDFSANKRGAKES